MDLFLQHFFFASYLTTFRNPKVDCRCIVYSVYVILLSCGIYYLYLLLSQIVRDLGSSHGRAILTNCGISA